MEEKVDNGETEGDVDNGETEGDVNNGETEGDETINDTTGSTDEVAPPQPKVSLRIEEVCHKPFLHSGCAISPRRRPFSLPRLFIYTVTDE